MPDAAIPALAPANPGYRDTLALLLAQNKDSAQALLQQRKALALQPDSALFRLNLARILVVAEQQDEARRELQSLAGLGKGFAGQSEVTRRLKAL